MRDAVRQLVAVAPKLNDSLDEGSLKEATDLLDQLVQPLSEDDARALLSLLPSSGDTAFGLNWTMLHRIEAAPSWPIWTALTDTDNEWTALLLTRLENSGYIQPQSSPGTGRLDEEQSGWRQDLLLVYRQEADFQISSGAPQERL